MSWGRSWKRLLKRLHESGAYSNSSIATNQRLFSLTAARSLRFWATSLRSWAREDIAVHHGSISKEERIAIEDAFKAGQLKAIICTSTLELGIDVGQVDLVVQYMSPRQVNSLIQRVGRSGHRLGRESQGVIITVYPDDTLEALASIKNAKAGLIEPVPMHMGALDVLAHQIAGLLMDQQPPMQSRT